MALAFTSSRREKEKKKSSDSVVRRHRTRVFKRKPSWGREMTFGGKSPSSQDDLPREERVSADFTVPLCDPLELLLVKAARRSKTSRKSLTIGVGLKERPGGNICKVGKYRNESSWEKWNNMIICMNYYSIKSYFIIIFLYFSHEGG